MEKSIASPTAAELAILQVLWEIGPATVKRVHECVYSGTDVGYTSSLKLLQNMLGKGLVKRTEASRQHLYLPAVTRRRTLNALVRSWIDETFSGSSAELAMQALDAKPVKPKDLVRLKELIAKLESKEGLR